jgi:cytochrome b561
VSDTQSPARYGFVAQSFHWLVVAMLIALLVTNSLREGAPKGTELRTDWLHLHMSIGILLFFVVLARIVWARLVPPPEAVQAPGWSMAAARVTHVLLNLSTLLIPVFGYLRVASKDRAADFFGMAVPSVTGGMHWLHELMEVLHGAPMELYLYILVGLHVAAALWHQYVLGDGVLSRMLPWGAPKRRYSTT